jgi:protein-arginine kinase activator protein McsA
MRNKSEWGNCKRCGKKITDNNLGDVIEAEEIMVCDSCAEKHSLSIIAELDKFRHSKDFNNWIKTRNKLLWVSEQMGNWFDNADKSCMESVSDYDRDSLQTLQSILLDNLCTITENYIFPKGILEEDYNKAIKRNPDMEKLRLEVREQQGRIASYINPKEWFQK